MSINAVSFAQRPYGYDPERGEFTPEQAKKDFRPGIIPEKKESHAVRNTVLTIGTIAAIAGSVYFLTTGKGIEKIQKFFEGVKGENFTETLKNIKDKGVAVAQNAWKAVTEGWKAAKHAFNAKKPPVRYDRKEILRELALQYQKEAFHMQPLKGYKGVNVNASPLNIGQRNKYIQDFEAAMQEYEKKAAQA